MDESAEILALQTCTTGAQRQELLAELFSKHGKRLKGMVRLHLDQRLQARAGASDVLQETSLHAAKGIDAFLKKPTISLYLWLRFLAARQLQELHRQHLHVQKRDAHKEVMVFRDGLPTTSSAAMARHLLDGATRPSEAAARSELRRQIEAALDSLEPIDRQVLALRHFEQLTNAEVAQVLGLQPATSRKRYLRALKRLRGVLGRMSIDGTAVGR